MDAELNVVVGKKAAYKIEGRETIIEGEMSNDYKVFQEMISKRARET